MAGIQVTISAAQVDKGRLGYQAISLTHFSDLLEPNIAAGSKVEIDGALYEFTTDEAGTGWGGIGNSNVVYMLLTPSGVSVALSYTTTAPTWSTSKQGWYTGVNRVVFKLLKDNAGAYASKTPMIPQQSVASVNDFITGDTTYSMLVQSTNIFINKATAIAVSIAAGAAYAGLRVTLHNVNVGVATLTVTTGAATVALSIGGSVDLEWNGTAWQYLGGTKVRWNFTSGTGATWKAPWSGAFDAEAIGGGGAGGDADDVAACTGGGGGGGGGTAIKQYFLLAGTSCTYTVGAGGTAPSGGAVANAGANSTFTDGTTQITGGGGYGGQHSVYNAGGGAGGTATNGSINCGGGAGGNGILAASLGANEPCTSGPGGCSTRGGGAVGVAGGAGAGTAGNLYGGGGGGALRPNGGTQSGGAGAAGLIMVKTA